MDIPELKRIVSNKGTAAGIWVEQIASNDYQHTIQFIELHPSSGNAALIEIIRSNSTSTAVASTAGTVVYDLGAYVAGVPQSSINPLMLNISDYIYVKLTGITPTAYIAVL